MRAKTIYFFSTISPAPSEVPTTESTVVSKCFLFTLFLHTNPILASCCPYHLREENLWGEARDCCLMYYLIFSNQVKDNF